MIVFSRFTRSAGNFAAARLTPGQAGFIPARKVALALIVIVITAAALGRDLATAPVPVTSPAAHAER